MVGAEMIARVLSEHEASTTTAGKTSLVLMRELCSRRVRESQVSAVQDRACAIMRGSRGTGWQFMQWMVRSKLRSGDQPA